MHINLPTDNPPRRETFARAPEANQGPSIHLQNQSRSAPIQSEPFYPTAEPTTVRQFRVEIPTTPGAQNRRLHSNLEHSTAYLRDSILELALTSYIALCDSRHSLFN